ncbi:transposase [Streptomyces sp. NPDC052043]|uniref:transposase n=1 Tax=Streptomyces sp. NPDC052043 TaxID=3365684 RepID=UPI0037CCC6DB
MAQGQCWALPGAGQLLTCADGPQASAFVRCRTAAWSRSIVSALPDSKTLDTIHQALRHRHLLSAACCLLPAACCLLPAACCLLPARHYLDSGYPSADLIVSSAKDYGIALVTPVLLDTSRQAKAQQGFAADDFTIDWDRKRAVCPAGKISATWNDVVQEGVAKTVVAFAALDCIPCPVKEHCTSSRMGRRLSLYPRELTETIRTAHAQQQDGTWQRD